MLCLLRQNLRLVPFDVYLQPVRRLHLRYDFAFLQRDLLDRLRYNLRREREEEDILYKLYQYFFLIVLLSNAILERSFAKYSK